MEKHWLIRTNSNKILGPVSVDKIKELLKKEKFDLKDEICSGNGFWFWIEEKDLVEKYVYQGQRQSFNPISEARNVLTDSNGKPLGSHAQKVEGWSLNEDTFSDVDDITVVQNLDEIRKKLAKNPDILRENHKDYDLIKEDRGDTSLVLEKATDAAHINTKVNLPDESDLTYPNANFSEEESKLINMEEVPSAEDLEYPDEKKYEDDEKSYSMKLSDHSLTSEKISQEFRYDDGEDKSELSLIVPDESSGSFSSMNVKELGVDNQEFNYKIDDGDEEDEEDEESLRTKSKFDEESLIRAKKELEKIEMLDLAIEIDESQIEREIRSLNEQQIMNLFEQLSNKPETLSKQDYLRFKFVRQEIFKLQNKRVKEKKGSYSNAGDKSNRSVAANPHRQGSNQSQPSRKKTVTRGDVTPRNSKLFLYMVFLAIAIGLGLIYLFLKLSDQL